MHDDAARKVQKAPSNHNRPHPNDHSDLEDAEGHVLSDHEPNEIHVERKGDKYEHTRASGT